MINTHTIKIRKILEQYFGIDVKEFGGNIEIIDRNKIDSHKFDTMKFQYLKHWQKLQAQDNKKLFIGEDLIIYLQHIIPIEEVKNIPLKYRCYYPLCTKEEIERIRKLENSEDFLLKLRADSIVDHPRFTRVFEYRRQKSINNWSLSSHFNNEPFNNYLNNLSQNDFRKCRIITAGYAFINEPNGICIKNNFGNSIIISEALQFFLYWMNLFLFCGYINVSNYGHEMPEEDLFSCFIIAIRIMLGTETLDFDIDPRGNVPQRLSEQVNDIVRDQIEFVIGHEYAHILLGHLNKNIVNECFLSDIDMRNKNISSIKYYNYRQKQEFEADWFSLKNARKYTSNYKDNIVNGAFTFFLCLDLFEMARMYISATPNWRSSHPQPIERLWKLRQKINKKFGYSIDELKGLIESLSDFKNAMLNDYLPYNIEKIEIDKVDVELIFDIERDHYQWMNVGWEDLNRVYRTVIHFDIKNSKIWLQQNLTEENLAEDLVKMGVPREDIVLGLYPPYKRPYTDYGVA